MEGAKGWLREFVAGLTEDEAARLVEHLRKHWRAQLAGDDAQLGGSVQLGGSDSQLAAGDAPLAGRDASSAARPEEEGGHRPEGSGQAGNEEAICGAGLYCG